MIDFDKFKYRVGDKVKRMVYAPTEVQPAIYEIIAIEESNGFGNSYRRSYNSGGTSGYRHYRLKNLSSGCLDQPQWVAQNIVHSQYEPSNPVIKLLYYKESEGTFLTSILRSHSFICDIGLNRAELAKPDSHSLDALQYSVQGQPSKKVSR